MRLAALDSLPSISYNVGIVRVSKTSRRRAQGRRSHPDESPGGDLLRLAREKAGFSQARLARQLRCTQQAVAQAERRDSNPTLSFLRRWATACGRRLSIRID